MTSHVLYATTDKLIHTHTIKLNLCHRQQTNQQDGDGGEWGRVILSSSPFVSTRIERDRWTERKVKANIF